MNLKMRKRNKQKKVQKKRDEKKKPWGRTTWKGKSHEVISFSSGINEKAFKEKRGGEARLSVCYSKKMKKKNKTENIRWRS